MKLRVAWFLGRVTPWSCWTEGAGHIKEGTRQHEAAIRTFLCLLAAGTPSDTVSRKLLRVDLVELLRFQLFDDLPGPLFLVLMAL